MTSRWQKPGPNANLHDPESYRASPRTNYASESSFRIAGDFEVRRGPVYASLCLLILIPLLVFHSTSTSLDEDGLKIKILTSSGTRPRADAKKGTYKSKPWTNRDGQTIDVVTLGETPYARCDVHSVLAEDGTTVFQDWIFLEEVDAVNVVVQLLPKKGQQEGRFVVFNQKKYAIPGDTFSPVGGFIEMNEAPFEAARREVMEELGVGSRATLEHMGRYDASLLSSSSQLSATVAQEIYGSIPKLANVLDEHGLSDGVVARDEPDWVFLGRYRTAANRGGGFTYTYLLKNSVPIVANGGTKEFRGAGDDEAQSIFFLTESGLEQALLDGRFQEVKWTAAISLSLLHLKSDRNVQ